MMINPSTGRPPEPSVAQKQRKALPQSFGGSSKNRERPHERAHGVLDSATVEHYRYMKAQRDSLSD